MPIPRIRDINAGRVERVGVNRDLAQMGELEHPVRENNIVIDTVGADLTDNLIDYTRYVGDMTQNLYNETAMPAHGVRIPRGRRQYYDIETAIDGVYDGPGLNYMARPQPVEAPAPPVVERTEEQTFKREYYLYKILSSLEILSNTPLTEVDFSNVDRAHGRNRYSVFFYDYGGDFVRYFASLRTEADRSMLTQIILNKYESIFGVDFA